MTSRGSVVVITPFYNTERYLAQAIESVLAQTFTDFEYLLWDNQSTDGSWAVAERYAARDPRIRLVRTEEFYDQDRNFSEALRHGSAGAQYVKLVLADDLVLPRCLERMISVAEENPTVGLVSSYFLFGATLMGGGLPLDKSFMPGREIARLHLQKGIFLFGSPTTVLFRGEVVREVYPFFDSAAPNADTEACYRTLAKWDFGFVHEVLSFLRTENDSRMGRISNYFPHELSRFIVVEKFGPQFLGQAEFRATVARVRDLYFRQLGDAWLTRRGNRELWEFHRAGLSTLGYRVSPFLFGRYILLALADLVFNPKKSLGRFVRYMRSRSTRAGN